LRSVDVMRGATVAGMVIVNNPGNWGTVFAPLLHAEWNGWTPTDLIFPFFLFIVGVSLTLGTSLQGPWGPVVRRTLVIAGLGLLMAGFPYFRVATWRIPGVLMRIALCYFFAVAVVRATAPREGSRSADSLGPGPRRRRVVAAIGVLLVSYWILEVLVPVPGQGQGRLVAGEDLSAWLDRALLGRHLWKPTWDPEGLLSTMPAVATTLLGVLAGWWLREAPSPRSLVRGLAGWGLAGVVAGLFWHEWFPINKSLWTSSYVLFTGGLASAALAGCYWWCDVAPDAARVRTSEPFVVLGRNAILLFVLSGLAVKSTIFLKWPAPPQSLAGWLYQAAFVPLGPPKVASLLYALAHLAVLYALLLWLHRRRLYFTA
jgi:predicted acyltransferase